MYTIFCQACFKSLTFMVNMKTIFLIKQNLQNIENIKALYLPQKMSKPFPVFLYVNFIHFYKV